MHTKGAGLSSLDLDYMNEGTAMVDDISTDSWNNHGKVISPGEYPIKEEDMELIIVLQSAEDDAKLWQYGAILANTLMGFSLRDSQF